jgi:curved DNA-binding protein CbpA
MKLRDCYRILGINPDTSLNDMHQAYRDLVHVWHPDNYVNNPHLRDKAEKQLKQINMAYDMLIQLFSEREQRSKEQQHKEQEERQRQEQGRAKQEGEESGQRERITKRGSLIVLKFPSHFFWRLR